MKIIEDKQTWNEVLREEFSDFNDVFFQYEYFELYKKHYNSYPQVIFWEDENLKIFWTHLVRPLSKINIFKNLQYFDLITPYGYGGPLINRKTKDKEKIKRSIDNFFCKYQSFAFQNKYISEFIRFHPVFAMWEVFGDNKNFTIEYLNDVVIVDLRQNIKEIWKKMKKGHKYNIRKSLKESCEVQVIIKPTGENVSNFLKVYDYAMDKNEASDKYYFPLQFIFDHIRFLNTIFIEVKFKKQIIGSSMFISSDGSEIIHYHLSGANDNLKGLYPSNLMLWEAIKWAKDNKFRYLHLGGGRASNDSLFSFKRAFSKKILPFCTGKKIFDENAYNTLTDLNNKVNQQGNYFPAYRQGLDTKII